MRIRIFYCCCFLATLIARPCCAQVAPERLAWKNLGKERWLKAEFQLKRALRKNSANLGANYAYAWFYFSNGNPKFSIDSTTSYVRKTIDVFNGLTRKEKDRVTRFPFDSVGLWRLKLLVDSAAFERVKLQNSEEGYLFFLQNYRNATQAEQALDLLHEVAFIQALKENTYQRFEIYLNKYPDSKRVVDARTRFEKLLFEAKTKDKKLASFQAFLREFPQSPYRLVAYQQVFELQTASGEVEAFKHFFTTSPESPFANRAKAIWYHLEKDKNENISFDFNDSLRISAELQLQPWFPVWKNDSYSFIDAAGNERLKEVGDTLASTFLCEGLYDDVIWTGKKVIARNGKLLAQAVIDCQDVGAGFLRLVSNGKTKIVHKSGFESLPYDAKLINQHFFWVIEKEKSSIYSLSGRKILTGEWERVMGLQTAVALKNGDGWLLLTHNFLSEFLNGNQRLPTHYYDEVKNIEHAIYVRKGTQQGLLSSELKPLVPLGEHEIVDSLGLIQVKSLEGVSVLIQNRLSSIYQSVQANIDWLVLKNSTGTCVQNRHSYLKYYYDQASIQSFSAIGIRNDSVFIHIKDKLYRFTKSVHVEMLKGADESVLAVFQYGKFIVLAPDGTKLGEVMGDKLEYMGENHFVATRKDKRFLVDTEGRSIPLKEYETFGNVTATDMAVLANKKFGLINNKTNEVITPHYDRALKSYNKQLIVAFKNGAYGLVDWKDSPRTKFEFDEIRFWNDSIALVRQNFSWRLLSLQTAVLLPEKISGLEVTQASTGEQLAIYRQDNYVGVMSNRNGIVLEPTYTHIQNLGTADEPFYFSEKFIEEASIYVVIYYSAKGKQVRKQVFEEEEYVKILCKE